MAKRLDISPRNIATIGDMQNDLAMFGKSGLSFAMGNAHDDVKAQATCVTDTNDNDGFAKAVDRIIDLG
jgi:hydroxymethylpyrimidine pyrophosphatase-like HAD family hydrolase